ncbi:hypothetical protein [Fodinicola feengrottensis]|uniref:hypothetical protein n=1 Tax=Fodinicola feengrottensis TaxID=435914 RepID=UPI0024426671|nr:hypothetical protein [Fodinicola feengrottensis]
MAELVKRFPDSEASKVRESVLLALNELYCPTRTSELEAYLKVFSDWTSPVDTSALLDSERNRYAHDTGEEVWICPALTDGKAVVDGSFLTRSDWRLENRIALPEFEPFRQLWLVRIFCDLLIVASEKGAQNSLPLLEQIETFLGNLGSYTLNQQEVPLRDEFNSVDGSDRTAPRKRRR